MDQDAIEHLVDRLDRIGVGDQALGRLRVPAGDDLLWLEPTQDQAVSFCTPWMPTFCTFTPT